MVQTRTGKISKAAPSKSTKKSSRCKRQCPTEEANVAICEDTLSLIDKAQAALHDSYPTKLLTVREKEQEYIEEFLNTLIVNKKSGSLYISGSPGTGKTMMLKAILDKYRKKSKCDFAQIIELSSMAWDSPIYVFTAIAEQMNLPRFPSNSSIRDMADAIYSAAKARKKLTLVLIDEVDQLYKARGQRRTLKRNSSFATCNDNLPLIELFSVAKKPQSKFVLIGIANHVDLFERLLPSLKANNNEPECIYFEPYSVEDLRNIVYNRLQQVLNDPNSNLQKELPFFDKRAIELCVRKIANFHGDCRQVLDACRRALSEKADAIRAADNAAEIEKQLNDLKLHEESLGTPPKKAKRESTEGSADCSTTTPPANNGRLQDAVTVGLSDVFNVLNRVYKCDSAVASEALEKMPLHQQVLLYSLCNWSENKAPTPCKGKKDKGNCYCAEDIWIEYKFQCSQKKLTAIPKSSVLDSLNALESMGIVEIEQPKKGKNNNGWPMVRLKLQPGDITKCMNALAPLAFGARI